MHSNISFQNRHISEARYYLLTQCKKRRSESFIRTQSAKDREEAQCGNRSLIHFVVSFFFCFFVLTEGALYIIDFQSSNSTKNITNDKLKTKVVHQTTSTKDKAQSYGLRLVVWLSVDCARCVFVLFSFVFVFFLLFSRLYLLQFSECAALYAIWPQYMTNIYVNKLEVISQHKLRSAPVGFVGVAVAAELTEPKRDEEMETNTSMGIFVFFSVSFLFCCHLNGIV